MASSMPNSDTADGRLAQRQEDRVATATSQPVALGQRIGRFCLDLSPWRRRGLLVLAGGVAAFALPPFNWVPLLIPCLAFLLCLASDAKGRRAAFGAGWWWGFGHFLVGDYWIANSFMIDPVHFGWMVPIVIPGLSAYLALYCGLASLVAWHWRRRPLSYVLVFAAVWPLTEWLRGHILTGYPWNLMAYSWAGIDDMMQSSAFWGSWGLGAVTVLLGSLPVLFLFSGRRLAVIANLAGLLVLAALWGGGAYRLANANTATVPDVKLRLVQAAIPQLDKLTGIHREENFEKHLRMSTEQPGFDQLTAVIWPESAAPAWLERRADIRQEMTWAVPRAHTSSAGLLVAGAVRGEPVTGNQVDRVYNSLEVLDGNGQILGTADKVHLVPLGEFVPLRSIFPFINKLTPGDTDFSTGPGPQTVHVPGLPPFGALICYEVIFPGNVVNAADRPDWLLTITNDGWFGTSTGPYQHFASARFRAVEEGLPLIRAANTGITGAVDAYGRVIATLPLGVAATLDVALPEKLQSPTTFSRFGILIFVLFSLVMGVAAHGLTYWPDNRNRLISQ
ncbi:MAG TPA: apolipoprotein N-acyltransferase [Dongiaceae bacterium]|nr:apolipoprotein N-acyltransferase [Dongiaceae bacterium]